MCGPFHHGPYGPSSNVERRHRPASRPCLQNRPAEETITSSQQDRLHGACTLLGIPPDDADKLIGELDEQSLEQLVRSAAIQAAARQAIEALRAEQRESMGGRIVPPLKEQIRLLIPLPPYVDLDAVTEQVLRLLHPELHA